MIPANLSPEDIKRLRKRAVKILELKGLGWSLREIAGAVGVKSDNTIRKQLAAIGRAKIGSLYWKLSVCDGDHAVVVKCYDLECWLCEDNPVLREVR